MKIERTFWVLGGLSNERNNSSSIHALSQDKALRSTALNERVNPSVSVRIPNASAVATLEFI